MGSVQTDRLYGIRSSLAIKAPVVAVAVAPMFVGGVLPTGLVPVQTPEGSYAPDAGDRILLTAEANPVNNGIYNASTTAWARSGDFDGANSCVQGTLVVAYLQNAQTIFYQLITVAPIIGTSPLIFAIVASSPNLTYPQTAAEAAAGVAIVNFGYPERDVRRYGVNTIPGTTDMTAAFTAALAVCAKLVPTVSNTLNWGSVCAIVSASQVYGVKSVSVPTGCGIECTDGVAEIVGIDSTQAAIIDTPVVNSGNTPIYNLAFRNLFIQGLGGAAGTTIGMRLNNAQSVTLDNVFFGDLAGSALSVQSGFDGAGFTGTASAQAVTTTNVSAFNVLLNTGVLTAKVGAFNIMGSDHSFSQTWVWNPQTRTLSSANKYAVGWNLTCNGSRFHDCRGSVSDQGWYIAASSFDCYYVNCRADGNLAEGCEVAGNQHFFENIECNGNGTAANNTYDHFVFDAGANRNLIISGNFDSNEGWPNSVRYCITDNWTSRASPNRVGPMVYMSGAVSGGINNAGGFLSVTLADGPPQFLTVNSATPSVVDGNNSLRNWITSNTTATTITNFTGGFVGQVIRVEFGDADTTIENANATIRTLTGSNITGSNGAIFDFKLNPNGYWQQI